MSIYDKNGNILDECYDINGNLLTTAYDIYGNIIFENQGLPIPSGNLNASQTIALPDMYDANKGFTCTGLTYDPINDEYLVGDIGILLPNSGTISSKIIKLSNDFSTINGVINLYSAYPNMADVQGITYDTTDNTIWLCSPEENLVRNITKTGENISSFSVSRPTGISYSHKENCLWVLTYNNKIIKYNKQGIAQESYDFNYDVTLDQCFIDDTHDYLYITAGSNYTSRNNIYVFNTVTHSQNIACTVDSYSVEGIIIDYNNMIILNDGYYHSAYEPVNCVKIYALTELT